MFNLKARINTFDRWMAAITFAEADEREIAMEVMGQDSKKTQQKRTAEIKRQENRQQDMRI